MGTPVVPLELGLNCSLCFPPGFTPKYVYVVFEDIQNCPESTLPLPNNQVFKLTQQSGDSCTWQNPENPVWVCTWYHLPTYCILHLVNQENHIEYFTSVGESPCLRYFVNGITESHCQIPYPGVFGGTGRVYYNNDPIPGILCESMGFHPGEKNLSHKTP